MERMMQIRFEIIHITIEEWIWLRVLVNDELQLIKKQLRNNEIKGRFRKKKWFSHPFLIGQHCLLWSAWYNCGQTMPKQEAVWF